MGKWWPACSWRWAIRAHVSCGEDVTPNSLKDNEWGNVLGLNLGETSSLISIYLFIFLVNEVRKICSSQNLQGKIKWGESCTARYLRIEAPQKQQKIYVSLFFRPFLALFEKNKMVKKMTRLWLAELAYPSCPVGKTRPSSVWLALPFHSRCSRYLLNVY